MPNIPSIAYRLPAVTIVFNMTAHSPEGQRLYRLSYSGGGGKSGGKKVTGPSGELTREPMDASLKKGKESAIDPARIPQGAKLLILVRIARDIIILLWSPV